MIELEADDALASAATIAARDSRVEKICIWTPDKDLAQCVREDRVVQMDRKNEVMRDAAGVRSKFGVEPPQIPDYLALVGDSADGYPGISRIGPKGAGALLRRYANIEAFPSDVLGERQTLALLFKTLATLRTDAPLFREVAELAWDGPPEDFASYCTTIGAPDLVRRAKDAVIQRSRRSFKKTGKLRTPIPSMYVRA